MTRCRPRPRRRDRRAPARIARLDCRAEASSACSSCCRRRSSCSSSSPIRSGSASGSASPTRASAAPASSSASRTTSSLWDDSLFWLSVFNTILYTVVASILKFALGLWLALLLNEHLPFKAFFRAIVLLPWVVPTVLSAIAFWWIYDTQFSIISWALIKLGLIDSPINFLGDHDQRPRHRDPHQCLARHPLRRDHAARRPADDLALAPRGGDPRRRDVLAAVPLHHAADAVAAHRRGDDLLGAVHLHRLPAHLRADPRRAAQRHAPHGDPELPARHSRRAARRGRGDRGRHGAVPARRDPVQLFRAAAAPLAAGRGPTDDLARQTRRSPPSPTTASA